MSENTVQIMLSFTKGGKRTAQRLKKKLKEKLQAQIIFYDDLVQVGQSVIASVAEHINKSDFFVPILTTDFIYMAKTSKHLNTALKREEELRTAYRNPSYSFIVPYLGRREELSIPQSLDDRKLAKNYDDVQQTISTNLPKSLLEKNRFSFQEWPYPIINESGMSRTIIVTGNSGKERYPRYEEYQKDEIGREILNVMINTKDDNTSVEDMLTPSKQSLRPASFIPYILLYLISSINNKRQIDISSLPIEVHVAGHLLKFRRHLIPEYNIITLGAGDTNLITRWILSYYQRYLPTYFTSPTDSKKLTYTDLMGNRLSSEENVNEYHDGILFIAPNPLNREKIVVVAAGLTALGTQGAMLALSNPSKLKELRSEGEYWIHVVRAEEDNWRAKDYKVLSADNIPTE